ncbi:RNA-directed DNA polymerase from mobile element jockey [Trichonephila clavipes]|nr:RNA-directed DNA polymerase from mobile element jockey [Trichonephila clavipes]
MFSVVESTSQDTGIGGWGSETGATVEMDGSSWTWVEDDQCLFGDTEERYHQPIDRSGLTPATRLQRSGGQRVSAADKACRVYPLDPRPDAVALYSGCTPGKPCLVFTSWIRVLMDPNLQCPGKGLVLPNSDIDAIAARTRYLILSLQNNELNTKSPFAINKALIGIDGQKNYFKKDNTNIPTKHLILTFNSPKLPSTIKAGYLNCKIRPYIPNPFRRFKCLRFGHSQTSCRGQLTCSRCASVGHSSTDCTLEPKCLNCTQFHPSESKLCPKWKIEKQIQEIKTNKNITYLEARKLIVPQSSHTYTQAAKPSNKNSSTQPDENITKVKCPPLKLLQPPLSPNQIYQ